MRSNAVSANGTCIGAGLLAASLIALAAGCVAPGGGATARTNVALAPLFGDHAVLQQGRPVPVWGSAGAGDPITVTFRGQTVRTVAGGNGRWIAYLKPLAASSDPADLVVSGQNTVSVHDVVVGEVWLCSGQSNMEFTVAGSWSRVDNADAEVAAADYPLVRQLRIERTVAAAPAAAVKTGGWQPASPKTVGEFTAVGYFFARDIHRALGVPVGIVFSAWGGTPIESWMSDEARASTSVAGTLDARWRQAMSEWPPERVARYPADIAAWQKAQANAEATHTKNPLPWPQPPATEDSPMRPGGLFNAMIAPLQPGALRGILWYQGESNVGHAGEYAELLNTLIRSWRAGWGQGDLPFYFVQLANFGDPSELADRGWARLREAQAQVLGAPATGMAVTIDIGSAENIHPTDKQDVGRRLALIAKARVYGIPGEFSGPVFAGQAREGKALRVSFTNAGARLVAHGAAVKSLELAGRDGVFHPAAAEIEGTTLLVSSPGVDEPVAVRYAWSNSPEANLYNDAGLPAPPFRSDTW
jgi:sialate O-acetylesterase